MKNQTSSVDVESVLEIIQNEYDEVIDVLKEKIQVGNVIKNIEHKNQFLEKFQENHMRVKKILKHIEGIRKRKTELARNIIKNQLESIQSIKNSALNSDDISKIIHELNAFKDKVEYDDKRIDNINYHHLGITMVGFFLAFFPFYNILAIGLGGYLLYSSDFRGKISGIGIISLTAILLIITRVLLLM